MSTPKIWLNMIVKDEVGMIEGCLRACRDSIDGYTIIDTGSSDDTELVIYDELNSLPGEVLNTNFENFAQARNDALRAACLDLQDDDYILFLDARTWLKGGPIHKELLKESAYSLEQEYGNIVYQIPRLVKASCAIGWHGFVHEYLEIKGGYTLLPGIRTVVRNRENRDRIKQFEGYLELLLSDYRQDSDNPRTLFYLGQTYFDLGKFHHAELYYRRRAYFGDVFPEEAWYAAYKSILCYPGQGKPFSVFKRAMEAVWVKRPQRMEPIARIIEHPECSPTFKKALQNIMDEAYYPTQDVLFIEAGLYGKGRSHV